MICVLNCLVAMCTLMFSVSAERSYWTETIFYAVLEAWKSVADKLRNISGMSGDGAHLVDAACGISAGRPKVAFNSLASEWEESEHKGLAMIMKGIYSTFRNPVAHAPRINWATSREDALDMLTLASMLHRRLDTAIIRHDP